METHDMGIVDGKTGLWLVGKNLMKTTTCAYYPLTMTDIRVGCLRNKESLKARTIKCGGAQYVVK